MTSHRSAQSAAGGVVFALASPPTDALPAVLVGLAILAYALHDAPTGRRAAWRALVWATSAGIVGMRFVPGVIERFTPIGWAGGVVALVLLSAFQGMGWALGAAAAHHLRRSGTSPSLAFGTGAFVAISVPTVFGWTPAGLLSPWPALLQLADVVGERGVSFLIAAIAALVAQPFSAAGTSEKPAQRWRPLAVAALVLAGMLVHGEWRMRSVQAASARLPALEIGIVQAAVPAQLRWEVSARQRILGWLREQTVASERRGAALTLWPEAAYPHVLPHAAGPTPRGKRAIVGSGVRGPLLFGLITQRTDGRGQHNSASLVDEDGRMQAPQAKMQLLWFGETVPLAEYFPFLRRVFFRTGGLIPGDGVALLRHQDATLGVLNCYEDTLPDVGRRIARERPSLLVNVTNDAWFGPTAEPELHLRLSVLRAIEARLDLVRAVNLGVPAWIDASGTVRARGAHDRRDVLRVSPRLAANDTSPTLYTKVGDVPLWTGLILAAAIAAARRLAALRSRRATERDP